MKPVFQDLFAVERPFNDTDRRPGNCVQACVASIFEMPLDDVPHFVELTLSDPRGPAYWYLMCDWTKQEVGVTWGAFYPNELAGLEWATRPSYVIAAGTSPRGSRHVCVADDRGEIIHDPRPEGGGLVEIDDYWVPCRLTGPEGPA